MLKQHMTALWRSPVLAAVLLGGFPLTLTAAGTIRYTLPPLTHLAAIVFTPDGVAWVSTPRGIVRIDPSGRGETVRVSGTGCSPVTTLLVGSDGAIWGASNCDVLRVDPGSRSVSTIRISAGVRSFAAGSDGAFWLSTFTGMLQRLSTAGVILSSAPLGQPNGMHSIVNAGGRMWGVHDSRLFSLNERGVVASFPRWSR